MNDETKAELMKRTREWLQSCVNAATRSGVPDEADLEAFILAHLDGEPARLAAAREEQRAHDIARSRKAKYTLTGGKNSLAGAWNAGIESAIEGVMSTPLDATPLDATPLAERDRLRTWVSTVSEALGAIEPVSDCRVELGADAAASVAASLRARVAALEAERDEVTVTLSTAVMWTVAPELVAANHKRAAQEAFDALERLRARVAELEAQLGGMTEQWKAELNHANAWMRKHQAAEAQVAAARAACARLVDRPWSRWAGDAGRDVLRAMDEASKK